MIGRTSMPGLGRNLIDGEWRDSALTRPCVDPSTGSEFGQVAIANDRDIDDAVSAAAKAQQTWQDMPVTARAGALRQAVERLRISYGSEGEATPLKQLISQEVGKRLEEADIEVAETADMLEFFCDTAPETLADEQLDLNKELWPNKRSLIRHEPLGVVACIKAWNYPIEIPIWTLGAALVAGNTVVFKPSENASLSGIELTQHLQQCLPPGVLNLINGAGDVGAKLASHRRINSISFTGSASVGRELSVKAAAEGKHITVEASGNDAALVLSDCDIELAANGLVWGAFCNSGQVCVGVKRVYAVSSIADDLVRAIQAKTAALRAGIDFGPLISREQTVAFQAFVDQAISVGAKLVATPDGDIPEKGFYAAPCVLDGVPDTAMLLTDECFGPVLPIVRVADEREGIERANASRYGLGASVWTRDNDNGRRVAEQLNVGMVWLNDVNVAFPQAPWGGRKLSGLGTELSYLGIREYTQPKHICIEESADADRVWWYPYGRG